MYYKNQMFYPQVKQKALILIRTGWAKKKNKKINCTVCENTCYNEEEEERNKRAFYPRSFFLQTGIKSTGMSQYLLMRDLIY